MSWFTPGDTPCTRGARRRREKRRDTQQVKLAVRRRRTRQTAESPHPPAVTLYAQPEASRSVYIATGQRNSRIQPIASPAPGFPLKKKYTARPAPFRRVKLTLEDGDRLVRRAFTTRRSAFSQKMIANRHRGRMRLPQLDQLLPLSREYEKRMADIMQEPQPEQGDDWSR